MKRINLFLLLAVLVIVNINAKEYSAVTTDSEVKWTGKKVAGEHYGFVSMKSGKLVVENNKITGGEFVMDMTSINCIDLEDAEWNQKLISHLKSDDFFSVEKHKESKMVIKKASPFNNGKATVTADLTIKGITHPAEFEVTRTDDTTYTAQIVIDRTKYDIRYSSGKFFQDLGDKLIYDDFTLDVKLVAK